MILHPIIDLLKRIVVALPDYVGGGVNVHQYIEFTPTSDITDNNKLSVVLDPIPQNYGISYVIALKEPCEVPAENEYTALMFSGGNPASGASNSILRHDGTIGKDASLVSYNSETNTLYIGGQYGWFRSGLTYSIYVIKWGLSNA